MKIVITGTLKYNLSQINLLKTHISKSNVLDFKACDGALLNLYTWHRTLLGLYAPELWSALRGGDNSRELPKNLIGKKSLCEKLQLKSGLLMRQRAVCQVVRLRPTNPTSFFGLCDGVPPANRGMPRVPKHGARPSATCTICVVALLRPPPPPPPYRLLKLSRLIIFYNKSYNTTTHSWFYFGA